MFKELLFNEFIHCLIVHEIKHNRSEAPHALKITVIKLQIWTLSPSLPPWHQAALARFASSLYSLLEGVMDLTLWGYPSWTLWGRQQDWLCRRSTQWGWRATSCPSRFAWPWSSLRIHHLQEAGKGDWSWASALACISREILCPVARHREPPLVVSWGSGKWLPAGYGGLWQFWGKNARTTNLGKGWQTTKYGKARTGIFSDRMFVKMPRAEFRISKSSS